MKKLTKGALFLAVIGTIIVGCEKEEEMNTNQMALESNNSIAAPTTQSKIYTKIPSKIFSNKSMGQGLFEHYDDWEQRNICLPPEIDCGYAIHSPMATDSNYEEIFFSSDGSYISSSFYNNYDEALLSFDQSLIDLVIANNATVELHKNTTPNNNRYVRFKDNNEDLIFTYALELQD
jgi:hypothetical protein